MSALPAFVAPARPSRRAMLLAGLFGLSYFLAHSGLSPLVPSNILWLLRHDWSQHYLGWAFFRHAAWSWPIGALPQVAEPDGSTLALLDGNPLWSLLLRPFASLMGPRWQFLGLYLATNFVLQGVAGAWLAARFGAAWVSQALFGALMVVAPVLLHRVCHDTLTAHWLLLVVMGTFWPSASEAANRRDGVRLALALALAAATHVYLLVMACGLAWMSALARLGSARWRDGLRLMLGALVGTGLAVGILFALGLLASNNVASASGFGFFSANVLSLIDPGTWSVWLPHLPPAHPGQAFEGFGYIGVGGLLVVVLGLTRPRTILGAGPTRSTPRGSLASLSRAPTAPLAPASLQVHSPRVAVGALLLVCGLFYVVAWSDLVFVLNRPLFDWRRFYAGLGPLAQVLRCTGRLVWPLGYAVVAVCAARLVAAASPLRAALVLLLAVSLQLGEANHEALGAQFASPTKAPLAHRVWDLVDGQYRHVALLPPTFPSSDLDCGVVYPDKYEVPLMLFAAEHGLGINSAYLARYHRPRIERACRRALKQFVDGDFRDDTLYVLAPKLLEQHGNEHLPLTCRTVDGYRLCVSSRGPSTPLKAALAARLAVPHPASDARP